jgi:hypothetical protein
MDVIENLYESLGYIEVHGQDILITITTIIATFLITGYTSYQGILYKIRSDWENQRCVPILLPFAGYIMPVPGKTSSEVTTENVQYCIKKDAAVALSIAIMPLEFALYVTVEFLDTIEDGIRTTMASIRYILNKITEEKDKLYNKVAYVIVPIVKILLYVRDALAKTNGVMTVALYTVMNIYNIIVSGSINLMKILSNLIITITAIMIALSVVAFALIPTPATVLGWSIFASALTLLTATIIPNIILYTLMRIGISLISNEKTAPPPKTPTLKKKKKK